MIRVDWIQVVDKAHFVSTYQVIDDGSLYRFQTLRFLPDKTYVTLIFYENQEALEP